jgi:galactokinase
MDQPTASYEVYKSEDESKENYDKSLTREEAVRVDKKLVGGQKNLDKNMNGKLDSHDFKLLRKTKVVAKPQYDKMRPAFKEEIEQIEERVDPKDYTVTSEPSKLKTGGHRPMVVHKDKGTTMYLGQTSYGSAEHAKGHAKAYLSGYAMGGDQHAMRKGDEYRKANAKHVVEENQRVMDFVAAMAEKNWKRAGALMYASHAGLQHDYEVSCDALDFLVDCTFEMKAVTGARMMGGGFGGCTINLVKAHALDEVVEEVTKAYRQKYGIDPKCYIANTGDGASEITPSH